MSLTSERLQTARDSPVSNAFSKRNFWHEGPSTDSFTRVRCMCTAGHFSPKPFATLERPPIVRYGDAALHGEAAKSGLLTLNREREHSGSVSSLEDDGNAVSRPSNTTRGLSSNVSILSHYLNQQRERQASNGFELQLLSKCVVKVKAVIEFYFMDEGQSQVQRLL